MHKLARIEPEELGATLASFAFLFVLMTAYYILKPVRDSMASDWSDAEVSWLWTINLVITLALNLAYGLALSVARLKVVVPVALVVRSAPVITVTVFEMELFERSMSVDVVDTEAVLATDGGVVRRSTSTTVFDSPASIVPSAQVAGVG